MRGQEAYPHHAPRYPPVTARRWGSRPTSRRPLPGKGNQKLRPDRKNTLRSALPGLPYLKALRWARPKINTAQIASLRIGDRLILSRPSAPEGVAPGRATILPGRSRGRSWSSSFRSLRAAGVRVPVSSEPSLRRHRGRMVSRRNVAINCRASRAHGVSRAGPSVDDAGRAAGSRDRLPLGQDPVAGLG